MKSVSHSCIKFLFTLGLLIPISGIVTQDDEGFMGAYMDAYWEPLVYQDDMQVYSGATFENAI